MADKDNYGDKDFENFMDDGNGQEKEECPKINEMVLIVSTIREKMKFINAIYRESLNSYEKIKDDDSLKPDLKKFITDLMAQTMVAMNQLDYALIDDTDDSESGKSIQEELPL